MYIIYEGDAYVDIYTIQAAVIRKQRFFSGIEEVTREMLPDDIAEQPTLFLLHEKHFGYLTSQVHISTQRSFAIDDLKQLIQEKITRGKREHGLQTACLLHRVRNVLVQGEPRPYLLGAQGDISFDVVLQWLQPTLLTHFRLLGGKQVFERHHWSWYPRSYYLVEYLHAHLQKDAFSLLQIEPTQSTLLVTQQGTYRAIEQVTMGTNLLRTCYEEHDVVRYFRTDERTIEDNSFLKKIVTEAAGFMSSSIAQRTAEHVGEVANLMVTGDAIRTPFFLSLFKSAYHPSRPGWVMPLSTIKLPTMERSEQVAYDPNVICAIDARN